MRSIMNLEWLNFSWFKCQGNSLEIEEIRFDKVDLF